MDTFKEKVAQVAQVQGARINEINRYAHQLFRRVKNEYEAIHEDFQYAARNAFAVFQDSILKAYLEAEFDAFKEAVSTFAKTQRDRLAEVQVYVSNLFERVRTQHEQLHEDFKQNVQETFDAFQESVSRHLEQLFGFVPEQIAELS